MYQTDDSNLIHPAYCSDPDCRYCTKTNSRDDAELHGQPWPRDTAEAAQRPPIELLRVEMGQ
jgi:hypothetical protein